MNNYKAIEIANWFIWRNNLEPDAERITLLKVLKLIYYAEGCALALGKSLFSEKIIAWEHGPVVKEVYNAFNDPYNLTFDDKYVKKINNDLDTKNLLEQVFEVFGAYTAWALRNKTHSESPWLKATENGKYLNGIISREEMKSYFKNNYIEA